MIAVVFDFDDTLTEDSTSQLLASRGVDPKSFWKENERRIKEDAWDPTHSYLDLLLQQVGAGKALGAVTNKDLRDFGAGLEFYPGIPELFSDLQAIGAEFKYLNPSVEIYIVSGGLEEVVRGSRIAKHVRAIRGCTFGTDKAGYISSVKRAITFTEKTRYLFEINKGVLASDKWHNPYDVNKEVRSENRRVPFPQMIYVGDGLTDVPCFSTVELFGGQAYGVVHSNGERSARAVANLLAPKRVRTLNLPAYRDKVDSMGVVLRASVRQICLKLETDALSVSAS